MNLGRGVSGKKIAVFLLLSFSLVVSGVIVNRSASAQTVRVLFPSHLTATYRVGDFHSNIKATQILLNQTVCPVTVGGVGSQSRETEYFGFLTEQAVRCFQRFTGQTVDGTITPAFYAALLTAVRSGSAARRPVLQQQEQPRTPQRLPREERTQMPMEISYKRQTAPTVPAITELQMPKPQSKTQIQQRIQDITVLIGKVKAMLRQRLEESEQPPSVRVDQQSPESGSSIKSVPQGRQFGDRNSFASPLFPVDEGQRVTERRVVEPPITPTITPTKKHEPQPVRTSEDTVLIWLPSTYYR